MNIALLIRNKFFLASQHIFFGLTLAVFFPFLKKYLDVSFISQIGISLSIGLMGQVIVNYCFQITGQTLIKNQKIKPFLTLYFFDIFYTKLVLFFVLCIFLILIIFVIDYQLNSRYFYLLIFGLPFCSVFNFSWVFYRLNQFKFLFYLSFLTIALQILCLYLFDNLLNNIFIILFLIFPYLIPHVVTFIILFKKATYMHYSFKKVIDTINKGKEIFFSQVLSIFYGLGGIILIKVFSDDQQVTDYLVLEKFFAPIISFSLLIIPASFPSMIDYYNKKSYESLSNTIQFSSLVFGVLFLVIFMLFFLLDEQLKYFFFDQIAFSLKLSYFLIFLISFFGSCFTYVLSLKRDYLFLRNLNMMIFMLLAIFGPISIIIMGSIGWIYIYFFIHLIIFSIYGKRILAFK